VIRRWLPHAVLLAIALSLLWQLERGEGGRLQVARLEQRNQALAADVAELKSGEAAVEDRARAELGMIKPGETFYRVVEELPGSRPAPAADEGEPGR